MILIPTFDNYAAWKAQVGNHDLVYYQLQNLDPAELHPVTLISTASPLSNIINRFFDNAHPSVLPPTFLADFPNAILCHNLVFSR